MHVAPGQEQHVAHEAAHVIQQGPAKAIVDAPNPPASDVAALEAEADAMGLAAAKP
ncbi:MAG TPA: hypothetical protein VHB97_14025 [Polyangia bacterium]|nr:hypothetical protein [Polyangia bacterium]